MKFLGKKRGAILLALFLMNIGISFSACATEKENYPIACHFEVVNPQTGDKLGDGNTTTLTWDGSMKRLDYCIRRIDNNEITDMGGTIKVSYTYDNPVTGHKEYNKTYMVEKGTYTFIGECTGYNKEKYTITPTTYVTVYLQ